MRDLALLKQLLRLAIPIFIGGAVQAGYHLINTFWVGRLGAKGLRRAKEIDCCLLVGACGSDILLFYGGC